MLNVNQSLENINQSLGLKLVSDIFHPFPKNHWLFLPCSSPLSFSTHTAVQGWPLGLMVELMSVGPLINL